MKHYNPTLSETALKKFKSKTGDMLPAFVDDKITPTVEIVPDSENIASNSTAATGTLSATPNITNKDLKITGIVASFSKNAACDVASGALDIRATIDGTVRNIARFAVLTLTAERDTLAISFVPALRIDRGTTIDFSGAFTAGAMARTISAFGYPVEP